MLVSDAVVQRAKGITASVVDVGPLRGFPDVTSAYVLSR